MSRRTLGPLISLGVLVALLLLVEVGARWQLRRGPEKVETHFALTDVWEHGEQQFHEADPVLGWRPVPGYRDLNVRLNGLGMRGPEPRPDAERRILLLGDSCTFGYAVAEEATFARLLEKRLGPSEVEVLNGGVIGYSSHQGVRLFRRLSKQLAPRDPDAVVVWFGYNDHHSARFSDAEKVARPGATSTWFGRTGVGRLLAESRGDPVLRTEPVPRVSVHEFTENVLELRERASALGARTIFLTTALRPDRPLVENFARVTLEESGVREERWMRQIDLAAASFGRDGPAALRADFIGGQGPALGEVLLRPGNLASLTELLRRYPELPIFHYLQARTLVARGLPADEADRRWRARDTERVELERYNTSLRQLAEAGEIELVDAARAFAEAGEGPDLFVDVVHPSVRGHAVLAELLGDALESESDRR